MDGPVDLVESVVESIMGRVHDKLETASKSKAAQAMTIVTAVKSEDPLSNGAPMSPGLSRAAEQAGQAMRPRKPSSSIGTREEDDDDVGSENGSKAQLSQASAPPTGLQQAASSGSSSPTLPSQSSMPAALGPDTGGHHLCGWLYKRSSHPMGVRSADW